MYLVKIKRLETGGEPVPLSVLADSLNVSPVSVNEMCRKLDEMELIRYLPYKGAALTEEGNKHAQKILRRHRLWEVFLVNKLRFEYEQAHKLADELEHVTTAELADRLDEFLGFPKQNTDGKLIPGSTELSTQLNSEALSEISVGENVVYSLIGTEQSAAKFLHQNGISNGARLHVLASTDLLLLVKVGQLKVHLSAEIAKDIRVVAEPVQRDEKEHKKKKEIIKENNMEPVETKRKTLKDLAVGESGVVVRVSGSGSVKQRLMDMGLVPGSVVTVVRVAPLGDPIEVSLKGYHLSLRKNEVKDIFIEN